MDGPELQHYWGSGDLIFARQESIQGFSCAIEDVLRVAAQT